MKQGRLFSVLILLLTGLQPVYAEEDNGLIKSKSVSYYDQTTYLFAGAKGGYKSVDQLCHQSAKTATMIAERYNTEPNTKIIIEYTGKHVSPEYPQESDLLIGDMYEKPPMHQWGKCLEKVTTYADGRKEVMDSDVEVHLFIECPDGYRSSIGDNSFDCIKDDSPPLELPAEMRKAQEEMRKMMRESQRQIQLEIIKGLGQR